MIQIVKRENVWLFCTKKVKKINMIKYDQYIFSGIKALIEVNLELKFQNDNASCDQLV